MTGDKITAAENLSRSKRGTGRVRDRKGDRSSGTRTDSRRNEMDPGREASRYRRFIHSLSATPFFVLVLINSDSRLMGGADSHRK